MSQSHISGGLKIDGPLDTAQQGPIEIAASLNWRIVKVAKVALAAVDTAGGVFSWANPESTGIIIQEVDINVTTQSSGACTLDIGTTAVTSTTSSNTLLTALSVAAAGLFNNVTDIGASGKSRQTLAAGKWVTASKASGATAGLVGFAYISYYPV